MIKKGWKLAGILGGAFLMLAGSRVEVQAAEETNTKETNYILEAQNWDNRAVADVKYYLNVRKESSVGADVIGVLQRGAYVDVVAYGEEWTQVKSKYVEGYIKTEFLVFGETAKNMYNEVHGVPAVITGNNVNVREDANVSAESIAKKHKGEVVEVLELKDDWYRIQLNENTDAYMHKNYVDLKDDIVAITVKQYEGVLDGVSVEEQEARRKAEEAKKKAEEEKKASGVSASQSEIAMLAAIIHCEAQGESYKGKVAVGAVVLNRVRSSKFPNTIEGVIKQKGQFTPVASGKFARVLRNGANSDCYQAAIDALKGSNPVGGALFFNTGSGRGFRLGNHQFY